MERPSVWVLAGHGGPVLPAAGRGLFGNHAVEVCAWGCDMEPLTDGQFFIPWSVAGLSTLFGWHLSPLSCTGSGRFDIAGIGVMVWENAARYGMEVRL